MRCVNEAQIHDSNCFVTLTYSDEHLPRGGTLRKRHLRNFFKRLRKQKGKFRYYACGEYGDTTSRAHYHACIFGLDFADKIEWKREKGHILYLSAELTKIWGHGNTSVGELNYDTASYTAAYVMKQILGKGCPRYVKLDETTGELIPLVQPFAVMSLRPAIGLKWLHAYGDDIYNKDHFAIKDKKYLPPRYYDKIFDTIDPVKMETLKQKRIANAKPESYDEQRARETITRARKLIKSKI